MTFCPTRVDDWPIAGLVRPLRTMIVTTRNATGKGRIGVSLSIFVDSKTPDNHCPPDHADMSF